MGNPIIQRGDLFAKDYVRRDATGTPVDLTGMTIQSCVKKADGSFTSSLAVTISDQSAHPGAYHVEGDTSSWPLGPIRWQTKFTRGSQVVGNLAQWLSVEGASGGETTTSRPYQHTQSAAAAQWIVNHNLGRKPAGVEVTTPGGLSIIAEVVHTSDNQLRVYLAQPATGSVSVF
jgi:hypothetical protein